MATESFSNNVQMDHAETLRKVWQHEDNIANNCLTWVAWPRPTGTSCN